MDKSPKFIDLFCGIGGFRIGFEKAGYNCVYSSDIDKHCREVYDKNFHEKPFGDITKIDPSTIPDFDVLTAGFPCQPFSSSGKRKGFEDARGTLFFDICRIIDVKRPSVIVLENVRNFALHDKSKTLKTVLNLLKELGYKVSYKVLNAKDFSLPQNRERIFIVASLETKFDFAYLKKTISKPLSSFLDNKNSDFLEIDEYTLIENKYIKKQENSGLIFVGYRNKSGFRKGVRPNTQHLSRVHRQPNRIYSSHGYHPTIPSQESSGRFFIYIPELNKVRKMSVDECYRIMGFPEDFNKDENLSKSYNQIGNSVPINIVNAIATQILEQVSFGNKPDNLVPVGYQYGFRGQHI